MKEPVLSEALQKYIALLGISDERLLENYAKPLPDALVVNEFKADSERIVASLESKGFVLRRVPWARSGYVVENGKLSQTEEFESGMINIQGPVSMAAVEALSPQPGERVLDMCAAPGGKTLQILLAGSFVIANEPSRRHAAKLAAFLRKAGAANYEIAQLDGRSRLLERLGPFDRVLVDSPCSGLGIASKDWKIARKWKPARSKRLSKLQCGLLRSGFRCLKPGGTLVYSTCTFTVEENELVVNRLLEKERAEIMEVRLPGLAAHPGIVEWKGKALKSDLEKCMRIYPFDNNAEGFFIAKLTKPI